MGRCCWEGAAGQEELCQCSVTGGAPCQPRGFFQSQALYSQPAQLSFRTSYSHNYISNNNIFIINNNNNNKNTLMGLELQTVPLLGRTKKQKKRNKIVLFILRKKALVDLTKIIERFPPIL